MDNIDVVSKMIVKGISTGAEGFIVNITDDKIYIIETKKRQRTLEDDLEAIHGKDWRKEITIDKEKAGGPFESNHP